MTAKDLMHAVAATNKHYVLRSLSIIAVSFLRKLKRNAIEKKEGVPIPSSLFIYVTQQCNLHCIGCISSGYKTASLDPATIFKLIDEGEKIGVNSINILGGEPCLSPYIEIIMKCAGVYRNLNFNLVTNGTLLGKKLVDKLYKYPNIIPYISIDGLEELHDQRRGRGIFKTVQRNIENLKERRIPFFIISTITNKNFEELTSFKYVKLCKDIGSLALVLLPYLPVSDTECTYELSFAQIGLLSERISYINSKIKNYHVFDVFGQEKKFGGCRAATRSLAVNSDGSLQPCPAIMISSCDYYNSCLLDCLRSPLMEQIRSIKKDCYECLLFSKRNELFDIYQNTSLNVSKTSDDTEVILKNGFTPSSTVSEIQQEYL